MKKVLQWSLVFIVAGILIYNPYRIKNDISRHSKYAIGTVYKESSSLKNGEHYHYFFDFMNKRYEMYNSKNKEFTVNLGDRFLVNFSYKNPEHCKILYEYPVKNINYKSPPEGWDSIPSEIAALSKYKLYKFN